MAYSNFTLEAVQDTFHLETVQSIGLFFETEPVKPSPELVKALARKAPLAIAMATEKAKSELIVSEVLFELWQSFDGRISLFSGIDFNVDTDAKLVGVCDFLVSLSPEQFTLKAPAIILVGAKRDSLTDGLGQCAAEMVAAQHFNTEKGTELLCIYGAITSGIDWLFLKLMGQTLSIDMTVYQLAQCDKILGILASMVSQEA